MPKTLPTHKFQSTGEEVMRYWADSSAFPVGGTVEEVNALINGSRAADVDFANLNPMDVVTVEYGWVLDAKGVAVNTLAEHFLSWKSRAQSEVWQPLVKVTNSLEGDVADIAAMFAFGGKEKVIARAQFSAGEKGAVDIFTSASGKFLNEEDLKRYVATMVEFHVRVQSAIGA